MHSSENIQRLRSRCLRSNLNRCLGFHLAQKRPGTINCHRRHCRHRRRHRSRFVPNEKREILFSENRNKMHLKWNKVPLLWCWCIHETETLNPASCGTVHALCESEVTRCTCNQWFQKSLYPSWLTWRKTKQLGSELPAPKSISDGAWCRGEDLTKMSPTIKVMASKHGIVVLQGDLEASCTAQRALCELMASFRWERYRMLWSSSMLWSSWDFTSPKPQEKQKRVECGSRSRSSKRSTASNSKLK